MKVRAAIYCTRDELYSILKGEHQEYNEEDVNYICKSISNNLLEKVDKFNFYADVYREDDLNFSERLKNLKPLSSFSDNENITILLEIDICEMETIVVPRKVFPIILYDLDKSKLVKAIANNRIVNLQEYEGMEVVALLNTGITERNILGAISYKPNI